MEKVITSGKRKTSVARAILVKGSGKVTINRKDYNSLQEFDKLKIKEPILLAENVLGKLDFDASISVRGGGEKSQIEAARLALARGIVKFTDSSEVEDAFWNYDRNLLVADIRRKEAYKPGDSKARSKRQSSKR